MLKMKLPMRAAEEGDNSVEEDQENNDSNFHAHHLISNSVPYNGTEDSGGRPASPLPQLNKEAVFEWFGLHLSPAKRIEFMCGLLHMCQPFELRFLGSCLEDLARKDFYILRDYEIKANSQTDLGLLVDVSDPVVHSKLLVCLSLLGSENRECAGILFRTLSHVYSSLDLKNGGVSPSKHDQARNPTNGGTESGKTEPPHRPTLEMESGINLNVSSLEQLALLFTMASLHPAFPFHQRETIRLQLDNVETAIEEYRRKSDSNETPTANEFRKSDYLCPHTGRGRARSSHPSRSARGEAVQIEKILLKEISASSWEYSFEVLCSDQSSSNVTKSHLELENFLLKLPKRHCSETCEKGLLRLLTQRCQHDPRDLERMLKEKFLSLPLDFRQMWAVCSFFLSDSSLSHCSHCSSTPAGKPCQSTGHCNDCSETSSLEEALSDLDLEPSGRAGAWMKRSSKGAGRGWQCCRSHPRESRRRGRSAHNGEVEWGCHSPSRTPGLGACAAHSEQCCVGEKRSCAAGKKPKARASGADRERMRRGEAEQSFVPNGIRRPSAAQKIRQATGPDAYGETSSESSYSTTSSPQHLQHTSLQSEDDEDEDDDDDDEDDRDTGSQSDNSLQDTGTLRAHPAKGINGKAVALVNPMLPPALEKDPSKQAETTDGIQSPPFYTKPTATLEPILATSRDTLGSSTLSHDKPPVATVSALSIFAHHASDATAVVPSSPLSLHPATSLPPHTSLPLRVQGGAVPPAVPTHAPSTRPTPSPVLTHSAAHSSGSSSACGNPMGLTTGMGTAAGTPMQMPAQPQANPQLGCNACGCRGSCGGNGMVGGGGGGGGVGGGGGGGHQATTGFFLPPQQLAPRQMFSAAPLPFLHLPSLCSANYPPGTQAHQNSTGHTAAGGPAGQPLSFYPHAGTHHAHAPHAPPAFPTNPLMHAHSEHLLAAQTGYGLPQMATFSRFYAPMFPSMPMLPGGTTGGGMKKGINMSCYNCGLSGHYAHECKQHAADSGHPGGFRLKYVAPHSSEALDKAD
ncbi:zinc finger CCHC domain-containing protein 2 isoform X2 [Clupea harengus]|uniref:Zinc finger CCHC domain-containing protein 2 isoform X2 n=1 Tax=Clupea harengus TaxID=7950 RepID=A0A6P8EXY3_CLUHA|nr:zinc finger CCHC domain-containing protein 2 isoform X2 [Clupea harengus]